MPGFKGPGRLGHIQDEDGVKRACTEGPIRDLILGDDALLYITYVMLIWAPLIPAKY